jgi:NTE family protein
MTDDLERIEPSIDYHVVPPLCPLVGSPYDFSRSSEHIARAIDNTGKWIADGGLEKGGIPGEMRPHGH